MKPVADADTRGPEQCPKCYRTAWPAYRYCMVCRASFDELRERMGDTNIARLERRRDESGQRAVATMDDDE